MQTSLLEELCNEMRGRNDKAHVVSSFVSNLKGPIDDIGLVFALKAHEIRKVEDDKRLQELNEQEERRQAEEAARLNEQRKAEKQRKAIEALRVSFCGKELEIIQWLIVSVPSNNGRARRVRS